MKEDLKFIVNEINCILGTDLNLILFDSLSSENILQILINVLSYFEVLRKFDVKFLDNNECLIRIIGALKKIQFKPNINKFSSISFRKNIAQGDRQTLYCVFSYIFKNKDRIRQLTYLARFLLPISLPPEAIAIPEVAKLWDDYLQVIEKFKQSHKSHGQRVLDTSKLQEVKNDINVITLEKANVEKQIEKTKSKLNRTSQRDLVLGASHLLRVERDRQKELTLQLEDQKRALYQSQTMQGRSKQELVHSCIINDSVSCQQLVEILQEQTHVLDFINRQKLIYEIEELEQEAMFLEMVIDKPNFTRADVMSLRRKVEEITKENQNLIEKRIRLQINQDETVLIFRQQALMVSRNKEVAARELNKTTKELSDINTLLQNKKTIDFSIDDEVLQGDDLKQYIDTLKVKSSIYKQQRSQIATIKAEVADIAQTLEKLKSQDVTLLKSLQSNEELYLLKKLTDSELSKSSLITTGLIDIGRMIDGITIAIGSHRDRVFSLINQNHNLKNEAGQLKDEYNSIKQGYDGLDTTLKAEASILKAEIFKLKNDIKILENNWQDIQTDFNRAETLLKLLSQINTTDFDNNKNSIRKSFQNQIYGEKSTKKILQQERDDLFNNQIYNSNQFYLWNCTKDLLEVKLSSLNDAKINNFEGTLSIKKDSEMLTLQ